MAPPARGVCGTVRASMFLLSGIRLAANAADELIMGAAAAAPASAASFRYGVIAKQAALILLDSIPALGLFAPNPRACEGRRPSAVGQQRHPHSGGQQSDPRSATRRRRLGGGWPPSPLRLSGIRFSSPSGLAGPAAHETLLLCGCVVGTEVGILLVRLSPSFSWTRGSLSTSDCGHGLSSAPEHAS